MKITLKIECENCGLNEEIKMKKEENEKTFILSENINGEEYNFYKNPPIKSEFFEVKQDHPDETNFICKKCKEKQVFSL